MQGIFSANLSESSTETVRPTKKTLRSTQLPRSHQRLENLHQEEKKKKEEEESSVDSVLMRGFTSLFGLSLIPREDPAPRYERTLEKVGVGKRKNTRHLKARIMKSP